VLLGGFLAGLVCAHTIGRIDFDFSDELERARRLGIVSITVLRGYPKQADVVRYLANLILPPLGALLAWCLWARPRRDALARLLGEATQPLPTRDRRWRLTLAAVGLLYVPLSFNLTGLLSVSWNSYVGDWLFLGEEGENLAWAQVLLQGGVYGKDFVCLYGPLLVYPLGWMMKLFEPTVLAERILKYLFDLASYAIVLVLLDRFCRWRSSFVILALSWFFLFPTFRILSVNFTYLRFTLPLLAVLLVLRYADGPRRLLLALAGAVLGLSLLFSQEAALCGIGAVGAVLVLRSSQDRRWLRPAAELALVAAGFVAAIAPMLIHLAYEGALGAFVDSLFGSPRLAMLGYGGMRTPRPEDVVLKRGLEHMVFFAVILLYAGAAAALVPRVLMRRLGRDDLLVAALVVFGSMLFMVAIRRYAPENVFKVWPPAVLLLFLLSERSVDSFLRYRDGRRIVAASVGALLLVAFGAVTASSSFLRTTIDRGAQVTLSEKWTPRIHGVRLPELPRMGGVPVHPDTASSLLSIHRFLEAETRPDEPVYFFPNEAAYYFVFNRRNPTRFAMAYFAVTAEQRHELVADLERHRPRYVIYSRDKWRIDWIPEAVQVPEVVAYLDERYRLHSKLAGSVVLERIDGDGPRGGR
jgi:hypothetical protein